jgi:hypothetical protein
LGTRRNIPPPLDLLAGAKIQLTRGMLHYAGAASAGPFQRQGEGIGPAEARRTSDTRHFDLQKRDTEAGATSTVARRLAGSGG